MSKLWPIFSFFRQKTNKTNIEKLVYNKNVRCCCSDSGSILSRRKKKPWTETQTPNLTCQTSYLGTYSYEKLSEKLLALKTKFKFLFFIHFINSYSGIRISMLCNWITWKLTLHTYAEINIKINTPFGNSFNQNYQLSHSHIGTTFFPLFFSLLSHLPRFIPRPISVLILIPLA